MRALCIAISILFISSAILGSAALAQSWPTTEWVVQQEDGEPMTGERAAGAEIYRQQLEEASAWFESVGFRPPEQIRVGEDESGPLGP